MNSKWQIDINGMYQAPYGIDIAANVFGRQGYPFPIARRTTLGPGSNDALSVMVTPAVDTFRYSQRVGYGFASGAVRLPGGSLQSAAGHADIFNLFNANTTLINRGTLTTPKRPST